MTTCAICGEDLKIVTVFAGTSQERSVWLHARPRTEEDEEHEATPAAP